MGINQGGAGIEHEFCFYIWRPKNMLYEISGFSKDKAEKKWFVENRWIPAVNALKDKYEYPEWHFIEISNDIRNIKKSVD